MSDAQTIVNEAARKCSTIFAQRPYGTGVQFEDIKPAEKQFAKHIQAACENATRDLLAACKALLEHCACQYGGFDGGQTVPQPCAICDHARATIADAAPA